MSLEERLRDCLKEYDSEGNSNYGKAITQLIQAFRDEGYSTFRDRDGMKFMTGQTWYDRFEMELHSMRPFDGSNHQESQIVGKMLYAADIAAKRASNLDQPYTPDTEYPTENTSTTNKL